ncbi:MAG TPA: hypothetical protein VFU38_07600, partial [Candidatus Krumholzibacteria bacterium]|nr:hypothetical protein [Candidatus Krumholzibacteria bacterium]
MLRALIAATIIGVSSHAPAWPRTPVEQPIPTSSPVVEAGAADGSIKPEPRFALAAPNTTMLASFNFDIGATCTAQGWTVVDGTAQVAEFWHVDDFVGANVNAGDSLGVLAGSQSLWCGLRAGTTGLACSYLVLPGYGNNWNQIWQTKSCFPVNGTLDVSFLMEIDSEYAYDATFLEYTTDCSPPFGGWYELDGGIGVWDGRQNSFVAGGSYSVTGSPVKVRIRFASEGGFSDEDGYYDSHAGPTVVDNLVVEGLSLEDFEGELVNSTETEDWEADVGPGF